MTIAVMKQLKQLQSKALKKIQGFNRIRTHDLRDTVRRSNHWAMKPYGSKAKCQFNLFFSGLYFATA